ncbi:hypothetical protein CYMTET_26807 [Cymbomonas tetramitiformis]|uniref:Uncharacterized protein n=1 Tax=Cymbomonas tetramitiformis TaxID=36881 RepID=A0AAE0KXJ2_9CHLO|nr:hypothetical protein CYMTET_26807 [Cymbomonas tetramitiformis]
MWLRVFGGLVGRTNMRRWVSVLMVVRRARAGVVVRLPVGPHLFCVCPLVGEDWLENIIVGTLFAMTRILLAPLIRVVYLAFFSGLALFFQSRPARVSRGVELAGVVGLIGGVSGAMPRLGPAALVPRWGFFVGCIREVVVVGSLFLPAAASWGALFGGAAWVGAPGGVEVCVRAVQALLEAHLDRALVEAVVDDSGVPISGAALASDEGTKVLMGVPAGGGAFVSEECVGGRLGSLIHPAATAAVIARVGRFLGR